MQSVVVEALTKSYPGGVKAVDGVSFSIHKGEIFGLLGPNGAGKSTTVRILATLTSPDSGKAIVDGYDVVRHADGVRHRIGYVAQTSGTDKYSTGRENLTLQAQLKRVPSRHIKQRVEQLLEWVGLADAANRMVNTYSGGMKRRLDIAMGLVHDPGVLFLDEPTTGLDPETRSALWRDLQRLREESQLSVLLTTHYLDEADKLCDRLAIVDHGKVVVEGTPEELKSQIRGDVVTLDVDRAPDGAAGVLRAVDGVIDVMADGRSITVQVSRGASAVPVLMATLNRAGIDVRSVTLSRPSLDDVYLHHTGHHYAMERETATEIPARPNR